MKRARGDDQSDGQVEQQNKKRMHQAHVSHEADIPKIELERQERIAKNKAMMEQLQLQEHAARLQHLSKASQALKKKAPRQERPKVPKEPSRRSSRHDGREKPNYNDESKLYSIVERPPKRRRTGGADRSRSGDTGRRKYHSQFPAWHPDTSAAPGYAQEAACAAAAALVKKLFGRKIFAQAKVLTESMVSGGFWLSVVMEMAAHLNVNATVVFVCDDETRPVEAFKDNQAARNGGDKEGRKWDVKFIDKGGSNTYGFSGNWRGFCIDQFLHRGDAVVFEVMNKSTVKVHVFRAWDYAAAKDKPADLETTRFTRVALQDTATADGAGDQAEQDTEGDVPAAAAAAAAGESGRGKTAAKASSKPSKKAADAGQKPAAGRGKKLPGAAAAAAAVADKPVRGKHSGGKAKAAAAVAGGENSQGAPAANPPDKKAKAAAAAAGAVAVTEAAAVGGRGRGSRGRGQQQVLQEPPARPSGRRTKAAAAAAAAEVLPEAAEGQGDDSSGGKEGAQAAVTGRKRRRAAAAQASTDAAPGDDDEAQEADGEAEERRMPAGKAAAAAAKPAAETASPAEGRSSDESAADEVAAADGVAPGAASAGGAQADRPEQGHTGRFSWLKNLLPVRQQ